MLFYSLEHFYTCFLSIFFPVVPSLHGPAQAPLLSTLWYYLPTFLLKNDRYVIVDR